MHRKIRTKTVNFAVKALNSPRKVICKRSLGRLPTPGRAVSSIDEPTESEPAMESEPSAEPPAEPPAEETPSTPTPPPAKKAGSPRVLSGSRIRLHKTDQEVTVKGLDVVGKRYYLQSDEGREWFEVLHGPGKVLWTLVATADEAGAESAGAASSEPAPPEAPPSGPRVKTRAKDLLDRRSKVNEPPACPICFDPLADLKSGHMLCCRVEVCVSCITRWKRTKTSAPKISRHHSEELLPDYNLCPFCKAPSHGGTSSKRIFGTERPVF